MVEARPGDDPARLVAMAWEHAQLTMTDDSWPAAAPPAAMGSLAQDRQSCPHRPLLLPVQFSRRPDGAGSGG